MKSINNEKKILHGIFLFPIVSIVLFSIFIFIFINMSLESFQEDRVAFEKDTLIQEQKNIAKNMVIDMEATLNRRLRELDDSIKKNLKLKINEASSFIQRIIQNNPQDSRDKLKDRAISILDTIRYNNGRGYYFVYDKTSKKSLVHPIKKFVGKDMSTFRDKRGTLLVKLYDKVISSGNGEGFANIFFAKPDNPGIEFEKIVYLKYIKELDWIVGTGEYVVDARQSLKKSLLRSIADRGYRSGRYLWVHDVNNILLSHPYLEEDIGSDISNYKDAKGLKFIELMTKRSLENSDGVFVEYYWNRPSMQNPERKVSFVKHIKNLDWILGTGMYLDDIDAVAAQHEKYIQAAFYSLNKVLLWIAFTSLLGVFLISLLLSRKVGELFRIHSKELEYKINEAVMESKSKDGILQEQSKLAAMGEMIGSIAHQWRQPLSAVSLSIQNLEYDYKDGKIDEKFINEYVSKNKTTIKFMSKTIDDFRRFFISNKREDNFSVISSIEEMLSIQSAYLSSFNISTVVIGTDFVLHGLSGEFQQVIQNIVNNAKDEIVSNHTKQPSIKISIESRVITISDNAGGIAMDVIDRIFEPYFTTKESPQGVGIGLYISKIIIEEHMGGVLTAYNSDDGAVFKIDFSATAM